MCQHHLHCVFVELKNVSFIPYGVPAAKRPLSHLLKGIKAALHTHTHRRIVTEAQHMPQRQEKQMICIHNN